MNEKYDKKVSIAMISAHERPRERLLRQGASALSTAELLAIAIRSGVRGKNAVMLAHEILAMFRGLRGLADVSVCQLRKVAGIGDAKIAQLKAIFELSARLQEESYCAYDREIRSVEDVMSYVGGRIRDRVREHFLVIALNAQNNILSVREMTVGTVDRAFPIVREIALYVLENHAAGCICVHNHPSGKPDPSPQDISFSGDLKRALNLFNIKMIDHVIVAGEGCVSLAERGVI